MTDAGRDTEKRSWTFLTNHAHVLLCIAEDPGVRGRDIAERVGITERSAQSIIADLVEGGYITRTKIGRRNHYEIHDEAHLRHPMESHNEVNALLHLISE
ncbi:MAG: winged helix-turn-helix domain-containing protein [Acidimicrobiales bacterium]